MSQVESQIQRKALLVLSGDNTVTSYLDGLGHVSNVYELNGTSYSFNGSVLRSHDFTDYTQVTKIGEEQRLLFNLAATGLSDVLYTSTDLDTAVISPAVNDPVLDAELEQLLPISVSLARDRFHKYLSKNLTSFFKIYLSFFS